MSKNIVFYSPVSLEPWNYNTPHETGIGGSETCHIELLGILHQRGHSVLSYNNLKDCDDTIHWKNLSDLQIGENQNWFVFREPYFFDRKDLAGKKNQYIFVAQDVDYDWNEDRLSKVDRYMCLCKDHADYTLTRYPQLSGRVIISSNGIRSSYIKNRLQTFGEGRNPKRLMYASSPDRGLLLILQNWFRIRERVPEAELHVFYGFNNVDEIVKRMGGNSDLVVLKSEIDSLLKQDGVFFHGRKNQNEICDEWMKSGVFFYPSDWPETSCISIMEAQACGAIPITNKYWAQGENCLNGILIDGIPQRDDMCKSRMIRYCIDLLSDEPYQKSLREKTIDDALDTFDWEKVATQWEGLLI